MEQQCFICALLISENFLPAYVLLPFISNFNILITFIKLECVYVRGAQ